MASLKELLFRLKGEETVSDAAKKAEGAIGGFGSAFDGLAKKLGAMAIGAAVGAFFKSAVEEAANAEQQMGRLGTAVQNAGDDFGAMKPQLEAAVASVMRMSTATDDDLREALTRMIAVSGDTQGSMKNLSVVADLAAYKQISVADAADLVGKAMNGNTTALNKMGVAGKDSATVLENLRATVGGFAQNEANSFGGALKQITNFWGEFQEAVGNAILSTGEAGSVATGLVGILADMASWVDENSAEIGVFVDTLADAARGILATGAALWDTFGPALKFVGKLLGGTVLVALETVTFGVRSFAEATRWAVGQMLVFWGSFGERAGGILKKFGINLGEGATNLRQFGQSLVSNAEDGLARAQQAYSTGLSRILGITSDAQTQQTATHTAGERTRTRVTQEELKKQQEAEKAAAKEREWLINYAMGILRDAAKKSTMAMAELNGYWDELDEKAKKAAASITISANAQKQLTDHTEATKKAQEQYNAEVAASQQHLQKNVQSGVALARAAIDVGQAMGVVSDKAAAALNSVLSMAEGLAKLAGPNKIEGVIQIVGALANAIAGIGKSETEKRRETAFAANTQAIDKLTREVGNLNLRESGKTFAGVQSAVQSAIQARQEARNNGLGPGEADKAAYDAFVKALQEQGVGLAEARALFQELMGREMSMANKGTWFADIVAFGQGLQKTEFGQFGQDFSGQLDAMLKGFDVFGTSDADAKLKEFRDLVGKFSPAMAKALDVDLTTPEGRAQAAENLKALFGRLKSGTLSPTDIGVSGTDFLNLITTILPLLAEADGVGGAASTAGLGASMAQNTVGASLGLGSTTSTVTDLPQVTGSIVAPPPTSTTVNGGIHVTVTLPGVSGTREAAEELAKSVDEILRRNYNRSVYATGAL